MPSVFQRRAAHNPAMVLAIILGCYLMVVLDASVVITALPDIRADLGFSAAGLSWVQNIYALAFGGLLLLGARAGDLLGRRQVFVFGIALFTAASMLGGRPTRLRACGRSPGSRPWRTARRWPCSPN